MSHRPRILLLAAQFQYHSPLDQLLPSLLDQVGRVYVFGPGYSSKEVLSAGLHQFLADVDRIDIVVQDTVTTALPKHLDLSHSYSALKKFLRITWGPEEYRMLRVASRDALSLNAPIIASLLQMDSHAWSDQLSEKINESCCAFISMDPIHNPLDLIGEQTKAPEIKSQLQASEKYFDFALRNRSRLIACPLFVDPEWDNIHEAITLTSSQEPSWIIPGTRYREREEARKTLLREGITVHSSRANRLLGLGQRTRLGRSWMQNIARYEYLNLLTKGQVGYATGSSLRLPLRKYFEFPAAGRLLVGQPFSSADSYGFIPGLNYISAEPSDLVDVHRWILANPEIASQICANGSDLISSAHTSVERAKMLSAAFGAVLDGELPATYWESGKWWLARDRPSSSKDDPGAIK